MLKKFAQKVLNMSTVDEIKNYIEDCFNKNIGEQFGSHGNKS